jgi:AraC-like DNA-binding protein
MTQTPNLVAETPLREPHLTATANVTSEALRMLRLAGAVYLRGEFTAPFGFESPPGPAMASVLAPGAEQLVYFHAIIEGSCDIVLDSGEHARVSAGEFVIIPYGNQHAMLSQATAPRVPIAELLPPPPWTNMQLVEAGGGGPRTRVLCCYLDCRDMLFNPLLQALPKVLTVSPPPGPGADWLRAGLSYSAGLAPGDMWADALGSRIPELLLVETLRQYLAALPVEQSGWLTALADPVIGDALLRIHGDPSRAWSVPLLAEELGVSRSALAARFSERLGQSPMRYIARWRNQLASHLLQTTDLPVGVVATRVGYESEPAFSRAFKRSTGSAPGAWRNAARRAA